MIYFPKFIKQSFSKKDNDLICDWLIGHYDDTSETIEDLLKLQIYQNQKMIKLLEKIYEELKVK